MELSAYVRQAIKSQIKEQKAPTPADRAQIVKVIRDLEGASRNLNQLAKAANQAMLGQGAMPLVQEMEATARRVDRLALDAFGILKIWA
ncbi:plasmid mobilization relaxosome protein MobC [Magnetospirillum sulfuroxidans]|uniref:Plasmid mobilization relaxosome protein MobC n=1 Tax=Magnetospirillum sulfuroxidans TaxID=611300 RepID=A0ABS5I9N6_9PROT|nr:plasmid mobilization relaxosome protein MobC [Magnetospirillum sulfuroxidans]MBR9970872.1 plasmid mobilization relaxosome protein MobC [Magnetospirillum sulfuroxidans]